MSDRAREDADGARRRDDAAVRSVSGAPPCGRKESGDDGGRVGRGGRRDRSSGCRSFAVAQSAGEGADEDLTPNKSGARSQSRADSFQLLACISARGIITARV